MAILIIDGVSIPDPSDMSWGLQDISSDDAGRGQDLVMHKGTLGRARTLQLSWRNVTASQAHAILVDVNPENFNVTYWDPLEGAITTRSFYVGDRSAMVQQWFGGGAPSGANDYSKIYGQISFNIIEVEPDVV